MQSEVTMITNETRVKTCKKADVLSFKLSILFCKSDKE